MGYSASSIDRGPRGRSPNGAHFYPMREALYPISQDTSVHCLIVLEHCHIREETVIYGYYIYDRILILSFTLRSHVVSLFLMSP